MNLFIQNNAVLSRENAHLLFFFFLNKLALYILRSDISYGY